MVLAGMAEGKYDATDLITAAAGPKTASNVKIMIEEERTDHEYAAENDVEQEPSVGLRSLIGSHVTEIESLPVNADAVASEVGKQ